MSFNLNEYEFIEILTLLRRRKDDRIYEKVLYVNDTTGYEGELVWRYRR